MLEKPVNPNYCGTIIKIEKLVDLPNCDNVQAAIIFNNSVIVGKDVQIGDLGVFFPIETQLMPEFLKNNNLYRDKTFNLNTDKAGYFETNGRIRAMKFRGNKSEGLFMPISCLNYIFYADFWNTKPIPVGTDFDKINGQVICKKYQIIRNESGVKKTKADKKAVKKFNRLVENQFRLMIDTENFRRNAHKLNPDDYISITNKIHGTSWVVGKVLVKELSWQNKLGFKVGRLPIPDIKYKYCNLLKEAQIALVNKLEAHNSNKTKYDVIYSSRMVVKNKYINTEQKNEGYYNFDLWGEIAEKVKDSLLDSFTLYGEAVGQLPTGGWIQKNYDYGTEPNHYDIYIYRITYTNTSGKAVELSWPQIKDYCNKYGLKHVSELYYGKAKDYCPSIPIETHWNQNFLNKLESDFMLDRDCPMCFNKVPEEGIVLRVENLFDCESYKLKNFRFLDKETRDLDANIVDMETEQTTVEETDE